MIDGLLHPKLSAGIFISSKLSSLAEDLIPRIQRNCNNTLSCSLHAHVLSYVQAPVRVGSMANRDLLVSIYVLMKYRYLVHMIL
jgi:hypothetical protein